MGTHYEILADTGCERWGTIMITLPRKYRIGVGEYSFFVPVYVPANWLISLWQVSVSQDPDYAQTLRFIIVRDKAWAYSFTFSGEGEFRYEPDGEALWQERPTEDTTYKFFFKNEGDDYAYRYGGYALISIEPQGSPVKT